MTPSSGLAASAGATPRRSSPSAAQAAALCVLCALVGAFYPTVVDWSKTAVQRTYTRASASSAIQVREGRTYPFSPITVVVVDDAVQAAIGMCFIARKMSLRALWADASLVLKMMPLGAIYAVGELLTFRSVQKSSGPVYVVIANMKLVVAAVMSRAFFGRSVSMPWLHWAELVLISAAAAVYTLLEAGAMGSQWQWEGAWAALAKSSLVAFSSVFCEHTYKSNPFYITLTLQACWGCAFGTALVALSCAGLAGPLVPLGELRGAAGEAAWFGGGPAHPLCGSAEHSACLQGLEAWQGVALEGAAMCHCVTARGWDAYTGLTVVADLSNAVSSALVFKQLSAVAKYVCRAASAVPMYIFYCAVGRSSWSMRTFLVVIYLCGQVGVYTSQRHRADVEKRAQAEWPQQYVDLEKSN